MNEPTTTLDARFSDPGSAPASWDETVRTLEAAEIAETVTCPAGVTVRLTGRRRASFAAHCHACPLRDRCTTAKRGRVIVVHPHHALLAAARAFAVTDAFGDTYRQHRPMVERSIAWLVRGANRRVRYRGTARNQHWLTHRVAAVNLQRLVTLGLTHQDERWATA